MPVPRLEGCQARLPADRGRRLIHAKPKSWDADGGVDKGKGVGEGARSHDRALYVDRLEKKDSARIAVVSENHEWCDSCFPRLKFC